MADPEHLEILKQGVAIWNQWRQETPTIHPDLIEARLGGMDLSAADLHGVSLRRAHLRRAILREADLRWADLYGANLREARLRKANLSGAHLGEADLSGARLRQAHLDEAYLREADLSGADLRRADLRGAHLVGACLLMTQLGEADLNGADLRKANLRGARLRGAHLRQAQLYEANLLWTHLREADLSQADLQGAILRKADLSMAKLAEADLREADLSGANVHAADLGETALAHARLVETNLQQANLTGCAIYGISSWGVKLQGAKQSSLRITPEDEPAVLVDGLEVAQFIHLYLHNVHICELIDTIGKKVVLILGRMVEERQPILGALQDELRDCGYIPMLYAMQPSGGADSLETMVRLTHLARFVLADMTQADIIREEMPQLVQRIAVPIQPLCAQDSGCDPSTLYTLHRNGDVLLETYWYKDPDDIRASLYGKVIAPAEVRAQALLDVRKV